MTGGAEVFLPAALAAAMAIAATVAVERWGGIIGGVLGTLPTTIVPAAFGLLAVSPDAEAFRDAIYITPVGMFLNAGFLWLWRVLPPRLPERPLPQRLASMVMLTLSAWAIMAALAVGLSHLLKGLGLSSLFLGLGATLVTLGAGLAATRETHPAPRGTRKVSPLVLIGRGLLAATAIAVSVLIARVGGSFLAGMAAVFPAIFLTTMVGLWLSQGSAVPSGAVGPMMLGSCSVQVFSLICGWSMPALGSGWGAALAWVLAALGVSLPVATWLRRKRA